MATEAAFDRYQALSATSTRELRYSLSSQAALFKDENVRMRTWYPHTAQRELWRLILLTIDIQLSPLFCYCLGVKEGFDDVRQQYEELAVSQYMTNPAAYKEAWITVLPEFLVQHCDALLAAIGQGSHQ